MQVVSGSEKDMSRVNVYKRIEFLESENLRQWSEPSICCVRYSNQ